VFYGYVIGGINSSPVGYIFSADSNQPELPSGYTLYASIPYFITVDNTTTPYASFYSTGNYILFGTPIPIVSAATNVTPTILNTSLSNFVSAEATAVDLLITHAHATNTSCAITIGHNSLNLLRTILTAVGNNMNLETQITIPLATTSIDTFLTASAGGTTYSVSIVGARL
jgi:hypothetical protein